MRGPGGQGQGAGVGSAMSSKALMMPSRWWELVGMGGDRRPGVGKNQLRIRLERPAEAKVAELARFRRAGLA